MIHYILFRTQAHTTEDVSRVRQALGNVLPPETPVEEEETKGYFNNPIFILTARLEKKAAETAAHVGEKSDIGWGHQIRSYVLQPYQLVKDLRTGVESRTPSDVLDGDLDPFMAAALAQAIGGKPRETIEDIE